MTKRQHNKKTKKDKKKQNDEKIKRQKDKKSKRQTDKKTIQQKDKKQNTKRQNTKSKKRVLYCYVRAVSHSCDVLEGGFGFSQTFYPHFCYGSLTQLKTTEAK